MSADDTFECHFYCEDPYVRASGVPQPVVAALRAVEAVRALHYEHSNGVEMACHECGHRFPCPTVQVLLGGER